jgi:hypothetical protein
VGREGEIEWEAASVKYEWKIGHCMERNYVKIVHMLYFATWAHPVGFNTEHSHVRCHVLKYQNVGPVELCDYLGVRKYISIHIRSNVCTVSLVLILPRYVSLFYK